MDALTTLTTLKQRLYDEENPILRDGTGMVPSEADFMGMYFPQDFFEGGFEDDNKREHSLRTMLGDSKSARSQRNKIFNGRYAGQKLVDEVYFILSWHSEFWKQLCTNCQNRLIGADYARLGQLLTQIGAETHCPEYAAYLEKALEGQPEAALASAILCVMLRTRIQDFMWIFSGTVALSQQFCYLDTPKKMMKRTFSHILDIQDFRGGLRDMYDRYASLLGHVTRVTRGGKNLPVEHLLDGLYDQILEENGRKILRILGPAGAEKNAITQLLYLRMSCEVRCGKQPNLAPYFLNLSYYRRLEGLTQEERDDRIRADMEPFLEFCANQPLRTPILFVDGVKNYTLDDDRMDYCLNEIMTRRLPMARYVIAAENSAGMNPHRKRILPAFAAGAYAVQAVMEPMYLLNPDSSRRYLSQFASIYPSAVEDLYGRLRALKFDRIDTYQLRMLLPYLEQAQDLSELYEAVSMEYLGGDTSELSDAAQWAFDFSYTDRKPGAISRRLKGLLNAHESFLEYFIAQWYLGQVRSGNTEATVRALNMVMPRGVTRFILPILNRNAADQSRILELIESSYDRMGAMAKCEMTYWLGRLQSPNMADRAELLLRKYYLAHKREVALGEPNSELQWKRQLFLLRSSAVSLIVKGDRDVSEEYINSLIFNNLANEINRGFHLEYYGDKPYLPSYDTLNFMDDTTRGKRTLDQLLTANRFGMESGELPYAFELNLFTICSLLQARAETEVSGVTFDIWPYMRQACEQAQWYLESGECWNPVLRDYLEMILRDFRNRTQDRKASWNSIGAESYTAYSKRVLRTGWVKRKVPEPESVAEHSYNAWLMGMMLLPDSYSADPDYSKSKILELILIHDLAETVTGDIEKPVKKQDPHRYEEQETREMRTMLLRCSYPSLPSQEERYRLWLEWYSPRGINGRIARELDVIQTMFQLLTYAKAHPACFEREDLKRWMLDRQQIHTIPGMKILRIVILENLDFQNLLTELGILHQKAGI